MTGSRKVSKAEWNKAGGLRNSRCWRKADANGRWSYYMTKD